MIKNIYTILAFAGFCLFVAPVFAASGIAAATESAVAPAPATESDAVEAGKTIESEWKNKSAKEKRTARKELKQALKAAKASASSGETVLLVILAILLPPLAMALYDGISSRFWISLLLWLLFILPGIIYTLVVILGGK
jgi:uncharacterized membrane protein YqaE (UPF0057 family)